MKSNKLVVLLTALALVGVACGSGSSEPSASGAESGDVESAPAVSSRLETSDETAISDETALSDEAASSDDTASDEASAETATPSEDADPVAQYEGSLESPNAIDGSPVVFSDRFSDAQFEIELYALVAVDRLEGSETAGSCYVVVGSMTPLELEWPISNSFDTPSIALIAAGQRIDSGYGDCDVEGAKSAEYSWILNAEVTLGTSYAFYDEIFVPGTETPDLDAVVVGDPSFSDAFYFAPNPVNRYPLRPAGTVGPNKFLANAVPLTGQSFSWSRDSFGWEGSLSALVVGENAKYSSAEGTCIFLVGTLSPTSIEGGSVTTGIDTPEFSLIVDGQRLLDTSSACESDPVEAAGYGWILNAEVTVGTKYPFFAQFLIPANWTGDLQAIAIGSVTYEEGTFFLPAAPVAVAPPAS